MQGIKCRLAQQGVKVGLEKSGVEVILEASFYESFGARPVERFQEGEAVTALSRLLTSGELSSGTIADIEGKTSEHESAPAENNLRRASCIIGQRPSYKRNGSEFDNQHSLTNYSNRSEGEVFPTQQSWL